ncbi:MAG TPA: ABC transporter ATP-binding protein [Thermoanaerobaculia bacterium]|nr:ABC transporter ATP-binding protein [Thermoanaerobaculia bacterium]
MAEPQRVAQTSTSPVIELDDLSKIYDMGTVQVEALRGINLEVSEHDFVAIVGPSGSGKSTLLNIIGCLDTPTSGSYRLRGDEVAGLDLDQLAEVRNRRIGFIFQSFNLLPQITAYENVELPLLFKGAPARERRERVEYLLSEVGLAERMHHRPTELSGGQMQRVAIARALACDPDLILADEPTGNLDSAAGRDVLKVFEELWEAGNTLVVITHDSSIAERTRRRVEMRDGHIVADERNGSDSGSEESRSELERAVEQEPEESDVSPEATGENEAE